MTVSAELTSKWLQAYQWVCSRRKNAPVGADIWDLRFRWDEVRDKLLQSVMLSNYRLSPMLVVGRGQNRVAQWSAWDALVLKFVALNIVEKLPLNSLCAHEHGNGGIYRSVHQVARYFDRDKFIYRTDIRGFYENIRKDNVTALITEYIPEPGFASLFKQYVYYSVEDVGEIHTPEKGICRGSALSPLVGASILWHVDCYFERRLSDNFFYTRYMDDFLFMSGSRWPIRRSIGYLNQIFELDGYQRHPDKTQMGRAGKGFDWLGLWFSAEGHEISPRSLENHQTKKRQLAERLQRRGLSRQNIEKQLQVYEARWEIWRKRLMEHL